MYAKRSRAPSAILINSAILPGCVPLAILESRHPYMWTSRASNVFEKFCSQKSGALPVVLHCWIWHIVFCSWVLCASKPVENVPHLTEGKPLKHMDAGGAITNSGCQCVRACAREGSLDASFIQPGLVTGARCFHRRAMCRSYLPGHLHEESVVL